MAQVIWRWALTTLTKCFSLRKIKWKTRARRSWHAAPTSRMEGVYSHLNLSRPGCFQRWRPLDEKKKKSLVRRSRVWPIELSRNDIEWHLSLSHQDTQQLLIPESLSGHMEITQTTLGKPWRSLACPPCQGPSHCPIPEVPHQVPKNTRGVLIHHYTIWLSLVNTQIWSPVSNHLKP